MADPSVPKLSSRVDFESSLSLLVPFDRVVLKIFLYNFDEPNRVLTVPVQVSVPAGLRVLHSQQIQACGTSVSAVDDVSDILVVCRVQLLVGWLSEVLMLEVVCEPSGVL